MKQFCVMVTETRHVYVHVDAEDWEEAEAKAAQEVSDCDEWSRPHRTYDVEEESDD